MKWLIVVALAVLIAARLYSLRPSDDPVKRAISACDFCGLSEEQVMGMIDTAAHSILSREGQFKLWEDTYEDKVDLKSGRELCAGCNK